MNDEKVLVPVEQKQVSFYDAEITAVFVQLGDRQLGDHERRLEEIESTLTDTVRNVTPEQASQIGQAAKSVAIALGKQTKKNEFGAVYGEMYRKFGITGYKLLPARRFRLTSKPTPIRLMHGICSRLLKTLLPASNPPSPKRSNSRRIINVFINVM